MIGTLNIIIAAGLLAILYSYLASKQILSADPGNSKMQEIANAIRVGARAYLNRQYKTIAIVGIIILIIITYALGVWVGLGYFIGAFLSGTAGYVGMLISVQANVRTAEGPHLDNLETSTEASVCPALIRTPPFLETSGKT